MSSDYFENFRIKARQLDDGIEKLITTWKLPHVLVGRFAECTEETHSHCETIWNIINSTQRGIDETLSEIKEFEVSVPIKQILQEAKQEYETLKGQCDNLDSVLAEYGYKCIKNDTLDQTNTSNSGSTDGKSPNKDSVEETKNLEVEFTPNLSWKCKVKQNELSSTYNDNCITQILITPVINKSVSTDNSIIHKDYICTPVQERPQEPIYSKHFYNILKK